MATSVYSSQLLIGSSSLGYPSFLVPENFVAVVRDVSAWDSAVGFVVQVLIQNSDAAEAITAVAVQDAGVPAYAHWEGRVVVPAGGTISLETTSVGGSPDVYVGGYLLGPGPST